MKVEVYPSMLFFGEVLLVSFYIGRACVCVCVCDSP